MERIITIDCIMNVMSHIISSHRKLKKAPFHEKTHHCDNNLGYKHVTIGRIDQGLWILYIFLWKIFLQNITT